MSGTASPVARSVVSPVASSVVGDVAGDNPPLAASGQTVVWKFDQTTLDLTSGAVGDFASVAGVGYNRPGGPRFGPATNSSFDSHGWSIRVPSQTYAGIANADPVFRASVDLSLYPAARSIGLFGGWFKFSQLTSNYKRVIHGLKGTTPIWGINAALTGSGAKTLKFRGENSGGTTEVVVGNLNQWIWLGINWEVPNIVTGSGTKTYRSYYMLEGQSTPTLISSDTRATTNTVFAFDTLQIENIHNDSGLSNSPTWIAAIGGLRLHELATLADGAKYPTELTTPTRTSWYVNASSGSDSNTGASASQAWQTASKLSEEIKRGTVLGSHKPWQDASGSSVGLETLSTLANATDWGTAYEAGTRRAGGDIVNINGELITSNQFSFESNPGITIQGVNSGKVTVIRSLGSTFSQPNVGTYPNVWQLLGADFGGIAVSGATGTYGVVPFENDRMLTPVAGANLAAVIATLNTNAGRCFTDGSGIYFSTVGGGNPNSDGIVRTAGRIVSQLGTGTGLVSLLDGLVKNIEIESCPIVRYDTALTAPPRYAVSYVLTGLNVADNVVFSKGCYHSSGLVGNTTTGAQFEFSCTHQTMFTQSGATITVAYTSEGPTACRIFTDFRNCNHTSVQSVGAEPVTSESVASFYSHGNARTQPAFTFRAENCNFIGQVQPSLYRDDEALLINSTCHYVLAAGVSGAEMTVTGCTLKALVSAAYSGTLAFVDCVFTHDATYVGVAATTANGNVSYSGCSLDFRGFASAATNDNGNIALAYDDCDIIAAASGEAVLFANGEASGDTLTVDNCRFWNSANPTVLTSWNDGSTTANRTYSQAVVLGIITNSSASAGLPA